MLSILYSPEIFSAQRVGGISRYIVELSQRLPADLCKTRIVAGVHLNQHLHTLPSRPGWYIPRMGPIGRWRLSFNQMLFRRAIAEHPTAIIHKSYYSETDYTDTHPGVITIHDMIDELFPERPTVVSPLLKRTECTRADAIIAVSETTKRDLINAFNVPPEKVTVVYHGDSLSSVSEEKPVSQQQNYVLYVGVREGYKNFQRLLRAFAASGFLRNNFSLIAFGAETFSEDETRLIAELKLNRQVRHITGDDKKLASSYRNATALICPSLYEGFGMPIVEAMGQGCPVISSRYGSLPEIAGEAAAFFEANDIDSISSVIEETVSSPTRLAELRARGFARHELFSWQKCANETLAVYDAIRR